MKITIETEDVIVTEVDESMLPKFDTEANMKAHVSIIKHRKQYLHTKAMDDHNEFVMVTRQRLPTVSSMFH